MTITDAARRDAFIAKGREAAFAGVGIGDRRGLLAAIDEDCGLIHRDRSAWVAGHEAAVAEMLLMAQEASAHALARVLRATGLTVDPSEFAPVLYAPGGMSRAARSRQGWCER